MYPVTTYSGGKIYTSMVPHNVYYPDRYVIFIKAYVYGEWVTEDFYVSEDVYESISVGDVFVYDEGRGDLAEEPCEKSRNEVK